MRGVSPIKGGGGWGFSVIREETGAGLFETFIMEA